MISVTQRNPLHSVSERQGRFAALLVGKQEERLAVVLPPLRALGATAVHTTAAARGPETPEAVSNRDLCVIEAPATGLHAEIRALRGHGWRRISVLVTRLDQVRTALDCGVRSAIMPQQRTTTLGLVAALPSDQDQSHRLLSEREVQVLQHVADGFSNKEIASALTLSALTVKSHLARIGRKMGSGDRAELVALGMRQGLIK